MADLHVVTGAFGYSGKFITERLLWGLLCTDSPPAGTSKLTDWAREHADTLGRHYASELARRLNRKMGY